MFSSLKITEYIASINEGEITDKYILSECILNVNKNTKYRYLNI